MNFIIKTGGNHARKVPFYKKRTGKVILTFFGLFFVFALSFLFYLYASGSKIFDRGAGFSPFIKMIKGEQSNILKEERVNILVMGRGGENHPGGLLTDSIMLVSIKPKENKVALMNIPRDLYVPIKGHGQAKINEAFADGYNDYMSKNCGKKTKDSCKREALAAGANLSRQTVSDVFGVPVHYYVSADFTGFEKLVDLFGGVDINVPQAIYDPRYPAPDMKGYQPFSIKAGQQHMDGKTALKYARSRESTSDFDRSKRQQLVLVAIRDKAVKNGVFSNPKKLLDTINIIADFIRTDMSPNDLKDLAEIAQKIDANSIKNQILSTDVGGPLVSDSSSGTYYIKTRAGNFSELQKIAQNIFQDSSTVTSEEANIEILNGSKTSGTGSKLAAILENKGYSIVNIQTAKEPAKTTIIYDYSSGKMKETLKYLSEALDAEVTSKTAGAKNVDISVVIGDNYTGINESD